MNLQRAYFWRFYRFLVKCVNKSFDSLPCITNFYLYYLDFYFFDTQVAYFHQVILRIIINIFLLMLLISVFGIPYPFSTLRVSNSDKSRSNIVCVKRIRQRQQKFTIRGA